MPSLYGQIVVTTNIIKVPCCSYSDSIDYNSDGNYDITIESSVGMDNSNFGSLGMGNTKVTSPYNFGQMPNWYTIYGGLTGTTIGCSGWYSNWLPGTGTFKYIGFRNIISVNDTVFGWIKIGFNGIQNTCTDTMITSTVAYCLTPNLHILTGQTTLNGIENNPLNSNNLFRLTNDNSCIFITNISNKTICIKIYNAIGQEVYTISDLAVGQSQSISNFSNGLFYIIGSMSNFRQTNKVYLNNNSR